MRRLAPCLALASALAAVDVEAAKIATADAAPLDPGALEVAFGATWTGATQALADGRSVDRGGRLSELGLSAGLNYGIAQDLDAGLTAGVASIDDEAVEPSDGRGLTDLEIGAKWRFWQRSGDVDMGLAVLPAVTLPLGSYQDEDDQIPTASRYWTVGALIALNGSTGIVGFNADAGLVRAYGSGRGGYEGSLVADAAVGLQITDTLQPGLELSWSRDQVEEGDSPEAITLTAGVQWGIGLGRLGLGVQRVVDGHLVDEATTLVGDLAIPLR